MLILNGQYKPFGQTYMVEGGGVRLIPIIFNIPCLFGLKLGMIFN